jgi:hypothetical protein
VEVLVHPAVLDNRHNLEEQEGVEAFYLLVAMEILVQLFQWTVAAAVAADLTQMLVIQLLV